MRPSIRLRSAAALSLIVTLIWLGTAAVTARLLTSEMAEVFDSALQETGQRILQLAVVDVLSREQEGVTQRVMPLDEHEEYFTMSCAMMSGASCSARTAPIPRFSRSLRRPGSTRPLACAFTKNPPCAGPFR